MSRRARICHINLAKGYRGGERQTELLIRALAGRGYQQSLVTLEGSPLAAHLADFPDVEVVTVRTRVGAANLARKAALVHAHETHAAQAALLARCFAGTSYIVTRRVDNPPGRSRFTRRIYRMAGRVVVLSDAIAAVMSQFDSTISISRIPSAASDLACDREWVNRFRAQHVGRFLVGSIGALDDSHKGQMTLIRAAGQIARIEPSIHFILVGSGRDEVEMRRAAAHLENVSFAGWSANVGDYLGAFDLFAYPSLHEGLGSILIDAMQYGLPIVASRVGGIPEIVADRENGWLVPPGDVQALSEAIVGLCAQPQVRERMARANRLKAGHYTADHMAEQYLSVYADILSMANKGERIE